MSRRPPPANDPSDAYLARRTIEKLTPEELLDYAIGSTLILAGSGATVGHTVNEALARVFYSEQPEVIEALNKAEVVRDKLADFADEVDESIRLSN